LNQPIKNSKNKAELKFTIGGDKKSEIGKANSTSMDYGRYEDDGI